MSPTKQITFVFDTATDFTVTEADGGIVFPLDNASAALGMGVGQCLLQGGIHLAPTANITAIFGPAHTDGTQQNMAVKGICAWGATGATVKKGLIYIDDLATNTTIEGNNLAECNTACAWVQNPRGQIQVRGNWMNVTSGNYDIIGSGLVIYAIGCCGVRGSMVEVSGNTIEHSNGQGQHEVDVTSAGDGSVLACIDLHDNYSERNGPGSTPSDVSVHIQDCWNCAIRNYGIWGGTTTGDDGFRIEESAAGRTQNVTLQNVWVGPESYTNLINDTVNSRVIRANGSPYGANNYVVRPGSL